MPADQITLIAAALYVALASMFSGNFYDSRFMGLLLFPWVGFMIGRVVVGRVRLG
jgi:hypothetical protein